MSDFASYRAKRLALQDHSASRGGSGLDVLSDLQLEVVFEISSEHADQPAPDTSQLARRTVGESGYGHAGLLGDFRHVWDRMVRHGGYHSHK